VTLKNMIARMLDDLEPIDRVMTEFERGGPTCARKIEQIRDQLLDLERLAMREPCQAQTDDDGET
jgi:hypothetical protein